MMKKMLSIALIAMTMFGGMAMAKSPKGQEKTDAKAKKEYVKARKDCRQFRGECVTSDEFCVEMNERQCRKKCPVARYDGLNLTADQKSRLQQLDSTTMAARSEKRRELKANKQRNDSVMRVERRQAKKDYLSQVKGILTPSQYVVFLENYYVQGDKPGMKPGHRGRK